MVHGFPPYEQAGTEVYTQTLSLELARRHEVAVLYRRRDASRPSHTVTCLTEGPLRLYELVQNLDEADVAGNWRLFPLLYWNPSAEVPFRKVLSDFRPDLVHFQHVIRLSASLIPLTNAVGIPAVMTLHDYWLLCPRIKLLKVDGSLCHGPRHGLECLHCMLPYLRSGLSTSTVRALKLGLVPLAASVQITRSGAQPSPRAAMSLFDRPRVLRAAFTELAAAVSPSRFLKVMLGRSRFPVGAVRVVPHGFDRHPYQHVSRTPARVLRLGFLGGLSDKKGLHVLLRAVSLVRHLPVQLLVFGELDQREPYHRELDQLARGSPVRFVGRFDHACVADVLTTIDVVVVPSLWWENDPLVVQESYLAGAPVIASRLGALTEKVRHEKSGLTFAPGDHAQLASQIGRLVGQPRLLNRLRSGLPLPPTVEENAAAVEQVYRDVLHSRHALAAKPSEHVRPPSLFGYVRLRPAAGGAESADDESAGS